MTTPNITIIIVTYNGENFITPLLTSLQQQDYPQQNFKVILVDNNSSDKTVSFIQKFPNIVLIRNAKNLGFGKANNIAFNKCTDEDYSILLNQDSIVEKDFITQLVKVMEFDSKIGICGSAEHPYTKTLKSKRKTEETNWIGCGATIVRTNALQQVGFFDPRYFMYSEDIDLCARLRCLNWKVYYHPNAIWHHYGWKRKIDLNNFRVLHSSVSRLYFLIKFGSVQQIILSLRLYLKNKKENSSEKTNGNIFVKKSKKNKFQTMLKILVITLPKIPFALIQRWKIRRLPYFNQRMIDDLIQEIDEQIYVK